MIKALGLIILSLLSTSNGVTVEVRPSVILVGGSVTVICRVPRMQAKRWLEIGIEEVQLSGHQLDGNSQTLWLQAFDHLPCDAGRAYCAVGTGKDPDERAFAHLEVGGCRE